MIILEQLLELLLLSSTLHTPFFHIPCFTARVVANYWVHLRKPQTASDSSAQTFGENVRAALATNDIADFATGRPNGDAIAMAIRMHMAMIVIIEKPFFGSERRRKSLLE